MFNIQSSLVHKGLNNLEISLVWTLEIRKSALDSMARRAWNIRILSDLWKTIIFSRPIITRYSQLESFHRKMIIRHPELAADIPFPRKRFFGNFNSSMLMKRTQQFRSYFLHILNGKNFKYRNSHIFRDFLISDQERCHPFSSVALPSVTNTETPKC